MYNRLCRVVNIVSNFKGDNKLHNIQGELISVNDTEENLLKNTDLIQKAINGNKTAFEQLYMQSYRYVFFVVRQYIPDDETTYDAIQETFIKVFKGISSLRSPNAYYSWLTTIAKNTAKNFLRSKRNESPITEDEDYSEFLRQDQTQKDVELDVAAVLRELQPQDAELLSLVYYDGMRVTQIAKMRGVPAATVYTQLNRAKRNLKSQLAIHGIDKSVYSGDFVAMIATAIRNVIGTALLSVAIAQQILNGVVKGSSKKEIAVSKVIKQQQKNSVLKIASCIVAISAITTLITLLIVFVLLGFGKNKTKIPNISIEASSDSAIYSSQETSSNESQNSSVQTVVDDNTHESTSTDTPQQPNNEDEPTNEENENSSIVIDSSVTSSTVESSSTSEVSSETEPPNSKPTETQKPTVAATYSYRDATAEDCFISSNIPATPVENVIVITGVSTAASDGVYIIPEIIDGKKVAAIMPSAFCDAAIKDTVKKVVVPSSVKTIWQNAFSDCYNLTDIYLRGSTIDIFESAFADLSKRNSKLTIHCSRDCKTSAFYYYRNIVQNYDADYQQWNGEEIQ